MPDIRACRDCGAKVLFLANHKQHLIPVELDVKPFLVIPNVKGGEQVRILTDEKAIIAGKVPQPGSVGIRVTGHRLHRDVCPGKKP